MPSEFEERLHCPGFLSISVTNLCLSRITNMASSFHTLRLGIEFLKAWFYTLISLYFLLSRLIDTDNFINHHRHMAHMCKYPPKHLISTMGT